MTKQELFNLEKICHSFRKSYCENYQYRYIHYTSDLRGHCMEISEKFGLYLLENHNIETQLVEGECYDCFHFWLEYGDYIIDLTIKQFENQAGKELPLVLIKHKYFCGQYKGKFREEIKQLV